MRALLHESPFAGSWYPDEPSELHCLLRQVHWRSSERTGPYVRPGAVAFVVPHAGPAYSGTVAAAAYRHLAATNATTVVILGFSHSRPVHGIAVPDVRGYTTPLGTLRVETASADALSAMPPFHVQSEAALCDHSVEIQLPFVQSALPDARVVPLYVGRLDNEDRRRAAAALRDVAGAGTVLIASSDLTHYGAAFRYVPFPSDARTPERLRELDQRVIAGARSLDPDLFQRELDCTGATVCGSGPIRLLLETLRGRPGEEIFQETLDYQTSGDITGDYRRSVSYAALAYFPASAYEMDEQAHGALRTGAARSRNLHPHRKSGSATRAAPSPAAAVARIPCLDRKIHCTGERRLYVSGEQAIAQPAPNARAARRNLKSHA